MCVCVCKIALVFARLGKSYPWKNWQTARLLDCVFVSLLVSDPKLFRCFVTSCVRWPFVCLFWFDDCLPVSMGHFFNLVRHSVYATILVVLVWSSWSCCDLIMRCLSCGLIKFEVSRCVFVCLVWLFGDVCVWHFAAACCCLIMCFCAAWFWFLNL